MENTDVETVQRMTGMMEIPEDLEREYHLRLTMLHRNGATGAMPPTAMVDLLRTMGYGPPEHTNVPIPVQEWRDIVEGSRVIAKGGAQGVFAGMVAAGTVAIKVDGDPIVREYPASRVRILDAPATVTQDPDKEIRDPNPAPLPTRDWLIPRGTPVKVKDGKDELEASFVSTGPGFGQVMVILKGDEEAIVCPEDEVWR